MPGTVIFLSIHWHIHLSITTSKIRVFYVYSTQSQPIYLLHYPTSPKYIFPSLVSVNRVIVTLTLNLNRIGIEMSSLSRNWLVVTPKPNSKKPAKLTDSI